MCILLPNVAKHLPFLQGEDKRGTTCLTAQGDKWSSRCKKRIPPQTVRQGAIDREEIAFSLIFM
jgi:hypothetical protein